MAYNKKVIDHYENPHIIGLYDNDDLILKWK